MTERHPLFAEFPVQESDNLLLRQILPSDAVHIYQLYADPEVTRHYDLETFTKSGQAREIIQSYTGRFDRGLGLRWGVCHKGAEDEVIGTAGYNLWLQSSRRAILGFDLLSKFWRRGIMTEALCAVLNFGFERMRINRVEATVFPRNIPSHALLNKLGFSNEGVLREYEYFNGEYVDLALYSLLRRERSPE